MQTLATEEASETWEAWTPYLSPHPGHPLENGQRATEKAIIITLAPYPIHQDAWEAAKFLMEFAVAVLTKTAFTEHTNIIW